MGQTVAQSTDTIYDAIYLSPHLDDVALSCGAQIFDRTQAGERILIASVTGGIPDKFSAYAQAMHQGWQLDATAVQQRRQEDATACAILGADHLHWPYLDCIYRYHPTTGQALYNSDDDIFGLFLPIERPLITQLASTIQTLPPHHQLIIPLTVGNHVDHQLTRLAAETAVAQQPQLGPLIYYEDYPYAQREGGVTAVIGADESWQAQLIPVTAAAQQARLQAVGAYASQLDTLFTGHSAMTKKLTTYLQQIGGERLWRPKTA